MQEIHESLDHIYNEMKRPDYSDQIERGESGMSNRSASTKFDYFVTDKPKKYDFF